MVHNIVIGVIHLSFALKLITAALVVLIGIYVGVMGEPCIGAAAMLLGWMVAEAGHWMWRKFLEREMA